MLSSIISRIKKFGNPGHHHWLNWPMTWISIIIIYGLYTGISGTTIGIAELGKKQPANIGIWVVIIFTLIVLTFVIRWQIKNVGIKFEVKKWLKYYIGGVVAIWLSNIIPNLIFNPLLTKSHTTGSNQRDLITWLFTPGPIQTWTIISTIFLGPFFEEFVFRMNLIGPKRLKKPYEFISNHRKVYAVISVILFTYLHMVDDINQLLATHFTNPQNVLSAVHSIIIYGLTGVILSYVYMKSNDIRYSMSVHMTWNFISLAPILLLILRS